MNTELIEETHPSAGRRTDHLLNSSQALLQALLQGCVQLTWIAFGFLSLLPSAWVRPQVRQ